jgi:hypothetical protein
MHMNSVGIAWALLGVFACLMGLFILFMGATVPPAHRTSFIVFSTYTLLVYQDSLYILMDHLL